MARRIDESHALAFAALTGPTVALYNALGMAPLFGIVAVAALVLARASRPWRRVGGPVAAVVAAMVAWAVISMIWTIEPHMGLYTVSRLVGYAIGGLILIAIAGSLDEAGQRRLRLALVAGVTIALVMATVEVFWRGPGGMIFYSRNPWFDSYIPRLGRGLTVSTILLVPAVAAAWRCGYRAWAALLLVLAVPVVAGAHTLSAKIGIAVIPVIFLLSWWRPGWTGRAMSAALVVLVLAFPLMALTPTPQETFERFPWLPHSTHHRMTIWNFTALKLLEHPVKGWGIEAARSIPGGEDSLRLWSYDADARNRGLDTDYVGTDEQLMPLHPHSAPGQIWLELGAVGAVLLCVLLVLLVRSAMRGSNRIDSAVMTTVLACAFIVASVSYGVWQSWWLGSLWFTAAFCVAISSRSGQSGDKMLSEALP